MGSSLMKQGKKLASKTAARVMEDAIKERDKTFNRPHDKKKSKDDPVDDIVRMAASGIGLVSEALHHRKEKKLQQLEAKNAKEGDTSATAKEQEAREPLQIELPTPDTPSQSPTENTGTPTQDATSESTQDARKKKKKVEHAKDFIERHPVEAGANPNHKLELPVVLPQRRPKARARGFMRAYAPVLNDAGIDQDTFIDFIETFNKVLEPNPWLNAINLAGFADVAFAEPMLMLVGVGLEIATDAIMEGQSRFRSNRFLDHLNAGFFMPRGLICMVVTWKPDAIGDDLITTVDVTHKAVGDKSTEPETPIEEDALTEESKKAKNKARWKATQEKMKRLTKASEGYCQWPDPAPLIYPEPIKPGEPGGKKQKNRVDRAEDWLGEYMDKRAQQEWREKHAEDPMVNLMPKPDFQSRYNDVNHPAASGNLVALVTGGRWGGTPKVEEEKEEIDSSDEEAQRKELKKLKKKAEKRRKQNESLSSGLVGLLQGVSRLDVAFMFERLIRYTGCCLSPYCQSPI